MSDPRRAPEWWPEGEPWPPRGWGRHRAGGGAGGPWRHGRPGRWRPFGCLVLLLGLFAAGALFMAFWALAAIFGLVEAPPIITGAGIVAFVVVLVGGLAVGRMLRRMAEPLDALIEASGRVEAGDYAARVPVAGAGGMRSLTRAFNQMTAQLQSSDERRRAFLAEVTHELRTPLTVIGGQLEAIGDGVYEADPERVAALLRQVRQMSGLIEDLHTISLAEVGALDLHLTEADLRAVAEEAVAGHTPAAQLAGVALRADVPSEPVIVALDAGATQRVLGNLVSNALRFAPQDSAVELRVRDGLPGGRLDITDSGRGMEPELAARAFDRFEKGPDSTGSGLGLAMARDLVEAQGGTIALSSTLGQGTRVSLSFPPPLAEP